MTQLDEVVEFLTRGDLDIRGGYPWDYAVTDDEIFIAEIEDDGSTKLFRTTIARATAALRRSKRRAKQDGDDWQDNFWDCLSEIAAEGKL